jgi:hypothetical protein
LVCQPGMLFQELCETHTNGDRAIPLFSLQSERLYLFGNSWNSCDVSIPGITYFSLINGTDNVIFFSVQAWPYSSSIRGQG